MKKIIMFVLPIIFVGCGYFKSSKDIELIPFVQKEKYGFFDLEGKIVINPQFSYATVFREDLALVRTTGENQKWGFIDKNGKFMINAIYKDATVFQEGLAWVVAENNAPSAIDKSGEVQFTLKEAENVKLFSEGLAAFSKSDSDNLTWGFVDKSGKQIINPQFTDVGDFYDGKCAVKNKEGKWGFIDKTGKIVINYQFNNVNKFIDGKAIVFLDDKAGVIDEEGKYIINPQFSNAIVDNDNYLIYQDDKVGWCDDKGKFIINPQFDSATIFGDNELASVKTSDKYGYIDEDGKIIINPQFDEATQFFGDRAVVQMGDKFGLIDEEGKYKVNPQFEQLGIDFFCYLNDFTYKNNVSSDYLDVEAILKVVKIENPENLSFNDTFQNILNKVHKSESEFSAYSDTHVLFNDKKINNDASYGFAITGNLKVFNSYTYGYSVTNEKPQSFIYGFSLQGKAYGKAESVQKAFEKKLTNYTLMKKGYIDGKYTSVFKSNNNIIITLNNNSSNPMFVIYRKDFDPSSYINRIYESINNSNSDQSMNDSSYEDYPAADTTVVDTAYSN